jgi:hypothetical protein
MMSARFSLYGRVFEDLQVYVDVLMATLPARETKG